MYICKLSVATLIIIQSLSKREEKASQVIIDSENCIQAWLIHANYNKLLAKVREK